MNKKEKRERQRVYDQNRPNKEERRIACKLRRQKAKERIYELLGNKCKHCGYTDSRAFVLDHVKGDGHIERGLYKEHSIPYGRVLANMDRYQLLCANCNLIKAKENNEFRGRKWRTLTFT